MRVSQATLDSVRRFNKRVANKVLIHLCGKKFGHFAILTHTGRKTGNLYRIPIIAEPTERGFVIALTYGKKTDWYENVRTRAGCTLFWKEKEYTLVNPQLIDPETGLLAFPPLVRFLLRRNGIEYFLTLEKQA